jgi:ferritin-like metal-binding protein YciE
VAKAKKTLTDLFHDQLQDAYSAETQLTKALPKMAKAARSTELQAGFKKHLKETENQISRLEKVCEQVGCEAESNTCEAMEGLISEGEEVIALGLEPSAQDAGLIAAAQKVEHYEIAMYGTLATLARQLGHKEAAALLEETLDEEKKTDAILTQLAESGINADAADVAEA